MASRDSRRRVDKGIPGTLAANRLPRTDVGNLAQRLAHPRRGSRFSPYRRLSRALPPSSYTHEVRRHLVIREAQGDQAVARRAGRKFAGRNLKRLERSRHGGQMTGKITRTVTEYGPVGCTESGINGKLGGWSMSQSSDHMSQFSHVHPDEAPINAHLEPTSVTLGLHVAARKTHRAVKAVLK